MSIGFRAAAPGGSAPGPATITVPAGVRPGDTCLFFVTVGAAGGSTVSAATTGTTVPAQLNLVNGPATTFSLFQCAAAAGDPGAVVTFTASAGAAPLVGILLAYSGAGLLQAGDYQAWTAPAGLSAVSAQFTPAAPGSWGIAFGGVNSGGPPAYAPGTLRGSDAFSVTSGYDSNGPVSPAGGGTWTNNLSDVWWGYTVALRPAVTVPIIPQLVAMGVI